MTSTEFKKASQVLWKAAKDYLAQKSGDMALVERHLAEHQNLKLPKTFPKLFNDYLEHACNRRSMQDSIGDLGLLRDELGNFEPQRLLDMYDDNWEKLFDALKRNPHRKDSRMKKDIAQNYWVVFCKATLSGAAFFAPFKRVAHFDDFVQGYAQDDLTRLIVPLTMAREIQGIGFALACDFLKDEGYVDYVKPDVHLCAILHGLGLSPTDDDLTIYLTAIRAARAIGQVPWAFDKALWMVGSGKFLQTGQKFATNRTAFIEQVRQQLSAS